MPHQISYRIYSANPLHRKFEINLGKARLTFFLSVSRNLLWFTPADHIVHNKILPKLKSGCFHWNKITPFFPKYFSYDYTYIYTHIVLCRVSVLCNDGNQGCFQFIFPALLGFFVHLESVQILAYQIVIRVRMYSLVNQFGYHQI